MKLLTHPSRIAILSFLSIAAVLFLTNAGPTFSDNSANKPVIEQPVIYTYSQVGKTALKAYVFYPKNHLRSRPVVVLVHGGGFVVGDASWTFDRAREFAKDGLVAISIGYRLCDPNHPGTGVTPVECLEDTCAAFTWVRQHAHELGIDRRRVVGYGLSAGGHLVSSAALLPSIHGKPISADSRPNVLMLYSPALNMGPDPYFVQLMSRTDNPEQYSPFGFVKHSMPPTIIIQGEEDTLVQAKDAVAFTNAAKKAGVRCELHLYPNVGHMLASNIATQDQRIDPDPKATADADKKENAFLKSLGYLK